jgi:hypothetical protein
MTAEPLGATAEAVAGTLAVGEVEAGNEDAGEELGDVVGWVGPQAAATVTARQTRSATARRA